MIFTSKSRPVVFDNMGSLEETLSGAGTSHRLKGILVQQAFTDPVKPPETISMEKTKRRSIEVPESVLPTCNAGRKPEVLARPDETTSTEYIQTH